LFCDLFDYVYGEKTFSWHRVWASVLSSMIGLVVFTLILGYENTVWPDIFSFMTEFWRELSDYTWAEVWAEPGLLEVAVFVFILVPTVPVFFNLVPDYFSLTETRLVLRWAKGRGLAGISLLILLDFILTATIFNFAGFLWVLLSPEATGIWEQESLFVWFTYYTTQLIADDFLIFFLTTFITSLFWLLFALTFCLIWLFHRLSPLANFVYYEIGQSDRPAAALAALLNGVVIIVYMLWVALDWAVS